MSNVVYLEFFVDIVLFRFVLTITRLAHYVVVMPW